MFHGISTCFIAFWYVLVDILEFWESTDASSWSAEKQKHVVSFDGNELYFFSLTVTWLIHLPGNGFEGNGSNFGSVTS